MSSPLKACHGSPSQQGPNCAVPENAKPSELPIREDQSHPSLFGQHVTEAVGSNKDIESAVYSCLGSKGQKPFSPVEGSDDYPFSTHIQHESIGGPDVIVDSTCTAQNPEDNSCQGLSGVELLQSCQNDNVLEAHEASFFGSGDVPCLTSIIAPPLSNEQILPEQDTSQNGGTVQCSNQSSPHIEYSGKDSSVGTKNNCVVISADPSTVVQKLQNGPFELQAVQTDEDGVEGRAEPINSAIISTEVAPTVIPLPTVSTNPGVETPCLHLAESYEPEILQQNEVDYIEDLTVSSDSRIVQNEQMVGSPISDGEYFEGAGSVNTAIRARAKRFGKSEDMIDGIAELKKPSCKVNPCASQTYAEQVENSIFWATERKDVTDPARNCGGKTKIIIRGVHVLEEEFVHTLKPTGHVDTNFMWLCSEALMLDWHSNSRTILNQSIINELMRPHDRCDHETIASKLKLLPLEQIDQLYLPVPNRKHWILVLITKSRGMIEIYDSFRTYKRGDDPYDDLWKTIGYNLQIALSQAMSRPVPIHDNFEKHYAQIHAQSNLHDCGLEVIRMLVCHNGKDLIGYGKKNMGAYRKEVSHTLLYHRYNDLNPRRQPTSGNENS